MLKKMMLNVVVGAVVMLLVFGPEKATEIYFNTHAFVVQALMNGVG